jgi:hypothetical protein
MSSPYVVAVEGLNETIASIDEMPASVLRFARMAINTTTKKARTLASRRIRDQVSFSATYLSDGNGRLSITKSATENDLEARIRGRFRPTSLARFATSSSSRGVRVRVKPGSGQLMRRAFLMKLRAGSAPIDTKSNQGLAIRLKPGERVENKRRMLQVAGNLYLLFGPSVDQVFASTAEEIAPETSDILEAEFLRLLDRFN